jgi:predicted metal-binding membrane protein
MSSSLWPLRLPLRSMLWILFFIVILASWAFLYMMATMSGLDVIGRSIGPNMMPMTSFDALFAMWAVMMAAMMLPTMVPTMQTYERLMQSADGTRIGWVTVLLGYFIVWVIFAAVIALAQVALLHFGLVGNLGALTSGLLTAALLVVVGAFQLTRAKEICHGVCHSPMSYFLGHWNPGAAGGLRMGLHLGVYCVVCCWGFMALGFAGGVMSLLWMGLATLFMIFEKLPQIGHRLVRPAGVVLILAGIAVALLSLI